MKEDVEQEIIKGFKNEIVLGTILEQFCDKFERLWLAEYKGLKYVYGDPLDGFYVYDSTLENFLLKNNLSLEELKKYYIV